MSRVGSGARMLTKSLGNSRLFNNREKQIGAAIGLMTAGFLAKDAAQPIGTYGRQFYNDFLKRGASDVYENPNPYWLGTKTPIMENRAPMGATGGLALAAHRNRLKY